MRTHIASLWRSRPHLVQRASRTTFPPRTTTNPEKGRAGRGWRRTDSLHTFIAITARADDGEKGRVEDEHNIRARDERIYTRRRSCPFSGYVVVMFTIIYVYARYRTGTAANEDQQIEIVLSCACVGDVSAVRTTHTRTHTCVWETVPRSGWRGNLSPHSSHGRTFPRTEKENKK